MNKFTTILLAALVASPFAGAHVSIEPAAAPAASTQKLTFRITHGCDSSATHTVQIVLPDAVIGAKPMPKAGWTVRTEEAALATPITQHGKTITSAVRKLVWQGGSLPDAYFDEFSIQLKLPETTGPLYFKVTQLCDKGRLDWVEQPAAGQNLKSPAPVIEVLPAQASAHQH